MRTFVLLAGLSAALAAERDVRACLNNQTDEALRGAGAAPPSGATPAVPKSSVVSVELYFETD